MITCPKCTKENQDHYKFCLGCGAELPRDAAPKPFSPRTPPQGTKGPVAVPLLRAPAPKPRGRACSCASASRRGTTCRSCACTFQSACPRASVRCSSPRVGDGDCPQCGHINQPSNMFCGACGFRLGGGVPKSVAAAPVAAAPVSGAVVLTALRADGTEAGTWTMPLAAGELVGRDTGGIFAGDSYLSPKHATLPHERSGAAQRGRPRLAQRRLQQARARGARRAPTVGCLSHRAGDREFESIDAAAGVARRRREARRAEQGLRRSHRARDRPRDDGQRFPDSRVRHPHRARARRRALPGGRLRLGPPLPASPTKGGRITLTDLASSNGTFIRLREETDVRSGDVLLMGQQLFRISM